MFRRALGNRGSFASSVHTIYLGMSSRSTAALMEQAEIGNESSQGCDEERKVEPVMTRSSEGSVDKRGAGAYGSAKTLMGPRRGFEQHHLAIAMQQDADGE
ncbi:hypothetical protein D3C81_777200 [compost metagenome]